jgi:hypothetical protein
MCTLQVFLRDRAACRGQVPWGGVNSVDPSWSASASSPNTPRRITPQTCGKVEHFHPTQKKFLDKQAPAATLAVLQAQLDTFRAYYNQVRPH